MALAAVVALHEWDTRTDASPADAARRAARLLSRKLRTSFADPIRTDSSWIDLEQHDGYTTADAARAHEHGQPTDSTTTAYVQVSVVVTLHGRDGWTEVRPARLLRVTLGAATGHTWLVDGFTA